MNMRSSFDMLEYANQHKKIHSVNLLTCFIRNNVYEVLANLLVSEEVPLKQKFTILDRVLCEGDMKFCELLSILPSSYMVGEWDEKVRQESFNELLAKNLQEVFADKKEYLEKIIIKNISKDYDDCMSEKYADKVIESFIKFNLADIDMNKITFSYDDVEITSAAAASVMGRDYLSSYLYDLPEYMKTDSKLRCQSDKVLLKLEISNSDIRDFISRKNYVNDREKTLYILDEIDKFNCDSNEVPYSQEDINDIIDILLRKTPKEEYKKLKQVLIDRKNGENVLVVKRQEITAVLGILNNYLLENELAKKKLKEIDFSQKEN